MDFSFWSSLVNYTRRCVDAPRTECSLCYRVAEEESASRPDKTDGASIPHVPYRIAIKAKSRMAPRHIDRAAHYSDNTLAQRRVWSAGALQLQATMRLLYGSGQEETRGSRYGIPGGDLLYGLCHGAGRAWTRARGAQLRIALGPGALAHPAVAPV